MASASNTSSISTADSMVFSTLFLAGTTMFGTFKSRPCMNSNLLLQETCEGLKDWCKRSAHKWVADEA
jgi:hypothetical protein